MNFVDTDLSRRRKTSSRFAWGMGLVALALYLIGFFIPR
jgi:hypothetical protein